MPLSALPAIRPTVPPRDMQPGASHPGGCSQPHDLHNGYDNSFIPDNCNIPQGINNSRHSCAGPGIHDNHSMLNFHADHVTCTDHVTCITLPHPSVF